MLTQEEDPQKLVDLARLRDELSGKLREPRFRRVRELFRTPLLCAMVCVVHWRESGYLPDRRVDLYDRCCRMLIEERDLKPGVPTPEGPLRFLTADDKEMLLERLALSMMQNKLGATEKEHQVEVSREEAVRWIKPNMPMCQKDEARGCAPHHVLDYLIERTGLVREPARGRIDFPHRTFQEYLAACAAGALWAAGDLARRASDDQWHETIMLAAGTKVGGVGFGNSLVEELLARGQAKAKKGGAPHAYFALAVACLETGRQIRKKLRARVLDHLQHVLPPCDAKEAEMLSAAGEAILSYLQYGRWWPRGAKVVAACARAIALVGSDRAANMLLDAGGYGSDRRATVLQEICHCPGLDPFQLSSIQAILEGHSGTLPASVWPHIASLSGLRNLPSLQSLKIFRGRDITDLSGLPQVPSTQSLSLESCWRLTDLSGLAKFPNLRSLDLRGCQELTNLSGLDNLPNLRSLNLSRCRRLTDLNVLANLPNLQSLTVDSRLRELVPKGLAAKVRVM